MTSGCWIEAGYRMTMEQERDKAEGYRKHGEPVPQPDGLRSHCVILAGSLVVHSVRWDAILDIEDKSKIFTALSAVPLNALCLTILHLKSICQLAGAIAGPVGWLAAAGSGCS
jgi:hypothetical protein